MIPLTPNDVRISRADGTASTTRTAANPAAWSEPTRRAVTNLANSTLENIIVELKTARAPADAVGHPPVPAPAEYLADPRLTLFGLAIEIGAKCDNSSWTHGQRNAGGG